MTAVIFPGFIHPVPLGFFCKNHKIPFTPLIPKKNNVYHDNKVKKNF
jgi:hypothetical protein